MPDKAIRRSSFSDIQIHLTQRVKHLCPVVEEVDVGDLLVSYTPDEMYLELHSFRSFLDGFADREISSEDYTVEVARYVEMHTSPRRLQVQTTWHTAGIEMIVQVSR